jgi:single-strand DNA-binding protein
MQLITVSGNIGSDAVLRQTQGGDNVCSFNVGVRQGWGDKASTNWYRCNVWGKRATTINEYLFKGVKVFVVGELTIGEYQGKPQYEIRVNDVEWEKRGGNEQREPSSQSRGTSQADLDDDVPF